jgi:hypothetical protein
MELIEILGISVAGSAYEEIRSWLKRLVLTGIVSEGAIYLPHRKKYASDTFHAFSRVITAGEELEDGGIADRHYVFLGDWLLESFNRNYVLPIEMEGYRKLRSPLAKTLVPHLQLWLYGSRAQRRFEKRYSDLCAICGIEICRYLSEIHRQLRTAMGELQLGGYIASWKVVDTADGKDFKVVIKHGEKFFTDQALLSGKEEPAKAIVEELPPVFQAMVDRGVTPSAARKLVRGLPDDQIKIAMDQLEYCDQVVQGSRGKIKNPPGFYVTFLRNNDPVPEDFVSSSKAAFMRMEEEARGKEMAKQWLIQQEYEDYVRTEVELLVARISEREREEHLEIIRRDVRKAYPFMTPKAIQEAAELRLRRNLRESSPLLTLDEFIHNRNPQLGFSF